METPSPTEAGGLCTVSTPTQILCRVVPGVPAAQEAETGRLEARVQKQPQETQSHE